MEINVLASGSLGNCYYITDGTTPLLIECGIKFSDIQRGCNFKLSKIAGCLITHEHKDHCKSVDKIMKAGIDCYMSRKTANVIGVDNHRVHIIEAKKQFKIGTWAIMPFETQHDAVEPLGFLLESKDKKLLYATDTFYVRYRFKGLTHIMIECNYCTEILNENIKTRLVLLSQKKRILKSHMSLETLIEFFQVNDLSKVEVIHLIHISKNNGYPEMFMDKIQAITGKPVFVY